MDARVWHGDRAVTLARLDRVVPGAAALLAALLYAAAHHWSPLRPVEGIVPSGWFTWFDAGHYLRAAIAWSHLDLRASEHWYPPGYPILGALGHAVTPVQPFYLPDLFALSLAGWLFGLLAAELLGRRPGARALGALLFLATTALNAAALDVWVTPWSTTPATSAIYGCLLAGMRFADRPRRMTSAVAGLVGGSIALFRPTEALLTLSAVGCAMAWALWRHRVPPGRAGLVVLAGVAGVAMPAAAYVAGEYATGGFAPDGYMAVSRAFGFEWRLIPLHWVEIFDDPRPLWPGEHGLLGAFPWILPGVAGMAAVLACCRAAVRPNHILLAGATALHCAVFLAFRDMHPNQIWWIFLYHYFKWVLPVFGLYAAVLPAYLMGRRRALAIPVALATAVGLFGWRPELAPEPQPAIRLGEHALRLPDGLGSTWDAVAVPARGSFDAVFHAVHGLDVDGRAFRSPVDVRAFPRPGGLLLLPVRPLPVGDTVITFSPGVTLDPDSPPVMARQQVRFGIPCWIDPARPVCDPAPLIPGPVLPMGQAVSFTDGGGGEFRGEGWAAAEAIGCWTIGREATLEFRVSPAPRGDVMLELSGYGYSPGPESAPSRVTAVANGWPAGEIEPPAHSGLMRIAIPAERLGPQGQVRLRLRIATPRRPVDAGQGGDRRHLGLMVRSIRLVSAN